VPGLIDHRHDKNNMLVGTWMAETNVEFKEKFKALTRELNKLKSE